MKKLLLAMAIMLLAGCSGGRDDFLKSLDGFWSAQDNLGKYSFTIYDSGGKLFAYGVTGHSVVLTVMTPNGEFISDTQRLPVKVEMYSEWKQGDFERHLLVEAIGIKHGYSNDEIYGALAKVDYEGKYDDRTVYKYLSELGIFPQQGDANLALNNGIKAELNAQRSLLKAHATTSDMVLQLDSSGQLKLGDGGGKDMVLVRERMLDKIDTDRMVNFQKLLDARALEIDKTIDLAISEMDANLVANK